MPLVHAGDPAGAEAPRDAAHERARKVRPEYARGELVRVAGGRNQAEAELIAGLLLEEGVPSLVRRSAGFDVPDFLAGGPRDVLVPESGADTARGLLAQTRSGTEAARPPAPSPRLALALAGAIAGGGLLTAALAWLLLGGG